MALSMAFWVMDVVDVCAAVVCLPVRQDGIRSIIVMMPDSVMICFVIMVHRVFCISICTKIMNLCNLRKCILNLNKWPLYWSHRIIKSESMIRTSKRL